MEDNKCFNCSECKWSVKTNLNTTCPTSGFSDFKCIFDGSTRLITNESLKDVNGKINLAPCWCPLMVRSSSSSSSNSITTPKEESEKPVKKKFSELPYWEKNREWEKIPPVTEWEDIKVGTVYHVPPFLTTKRKDIIITSKTDYSISYREVNGNNKILYTAYPTNLLVNFLVPHRLKHVNV